jgi:hypothetical protein
LGNDFLPAGTSIVTDDLPRNDAAPLATATRLDRTSQTESCRLRYREHLPLMR